ncbi:hypothetical protein GQR58_025592 [Nymphon striatum]|nr:hypothetical protein GQR58_025592 [Nymphon striatum]
MENDYNLSFFDTSKQIINTRSVSTRNRILLAARLGHIIVITQARLKVQNKTTFPIGNLDILKAVCVEYGRKDVINVRQKLNFYRFRKQGNVSKAFANFKPDRKWHQKLMGALRRIAYHWTRKTYLPVNPQWSQIGRLRERIISWIKNARKQHNTSVRPSINTCGINLQSLISQGKIQKFNWCKGNKKKERGTKQDEAENFAGRAEYSAVSAIRVALV